MKLTIKVVPGSSREDIAGWLGDELKVRVRQVPEAGKVNQAVRKLHSKTLATPLQNVRIVSGESSPRKTIEIIGLEEREVRQRLGVQ